MSKLRLFCGAIALSALSTSSPMAQAQETLKIAAGQRGNWDTTIAEVGQRGLLDAGDLRRTRATRSGRATGAVLRVSP